MPYGYAGEPGEGATPDGSTLTLNGSGQLAINPSGSPAVASLELSGEDGSGLRLGTGTGLYGEVCTLYRDSNGNNFPAVYCPTLGQDGQTHFPLVVNQVTGETSLNGCGVPVVAVNWQGTVMGDGSLYGSGGTWTLEGTPTKVLASDGSGIQFVDASALAGQFGLPSGSYTTTGSYPFTYNLSATFDVSGSETCGGLNVTLEITPHAAFPDFQTHGYGYYYGFYDNYFSIKEFGKIVLKGGTWGDGRYGTDFYCAQYNPSGSVMRISPFSVAFENFPEGLAVPLGDTAVIDGSVSGHAYMNAPFRTRVAGGGNSGPTSYKKIIIRFAGLTDAGQTVYYQTYFDYPPVVVANTTGLTISTITTTHLNLPAASNVSGFIILEGY
jgi:hypothetical protein